MRTVVIAVAFLVASGAACKGRHKAQDAGVPDAQADAGTPDSAPDVTPDTTDGGAP